MDTNQKEMLLELIEKIAPYYVDEYTILNDNLEESNFIQTGTNYKSDYGTFLCSIQVFTSETDIIPFRFYLYPEITIQENKRQAVSELLIRLNAAFGQAQWILDFDEGLIYLKTILYIDKTNLPLYQIEMQSKIMYELFEMHIGAIFKVAFGDQSPKHIFAELMNEQDYTMN